MAKRSSSKRNGTLFTALVSVLLASILVGSGVFLWQQNVTKKQIADLNTETAKNACTGIWKNGTCIKITCVDSDVNDKPKDIYIKGSVTFVNASGIETTVNDGCLNKTQVEEMWCYESPTGSGNYVQGKRIYNCPKGCLNGACIK